MWHEARRQEKLIRSTMIDQSKRAERKRRYFEHVRKDPEQFMQVHGRKSHIHADLSIAKAAEDANILRPWQGEPNITIDRFDARSHLTKMDLMEDETIRKKSNDEIDDEKEELVCEFERYRVLIINDYKCVSEKSYLKKIAEREFWQVEKDTSKKLEMDKKKKSAENKSKIGFSYEDSETVKGNSNDSPSDSEEEMAEMEDLDVDIDTVHMNAELQRKANKYGEEYGVKRGLFCALLRADQQAQRDAAQLKQIDRQKAQLSGRESKHERMLLRQQRQAIVGKGCLSGSGGATATLLGFINDSHKRSKVDEIMDDMEGSDNEEERAKPQFITTFGGADGVESDEEVKKTTVGPQLPSEQYRKILNLAHNRNKEETVDWGNIPISGDVDKSRRSRSRSSSRGRNDRRRSRSRSKERYSSRRDRRSRSRSRRRRARSRTRSRSRDRQRSRDRRRRSRSSSRRRDYSRRRHRSRSRSHDRSRKNRSRSRSKSRERGSRREKPMFDEEKTKRREKSPTPQSRSTSRSSSGSEENEMSERNDSEPEENEEIKMLEIRSSMSESEKERIEIENRKRRVKLTKKMVKEKRKGAEESSEDDEEQQKQNDIARRMRQKMNQVLKKTRAELAKEEEERKREVELERRVREEIRFIEEQERRERERAKRKVKDGEKSRSRDDSRERRRRSRSPS